MECRSRDQLQPCWCQPKSYRPKTPVAQGNTGCFSLEATSLLVDKTYYPVEAWSQQGDSGEKDSDNEAARDEPIRPALDREELTFFKRDHQLLHKLFHQAREVSFGKCLWENICAEFLPDPCVTGARSVTQHQPEGEVPTGFDESRVGGRGGGSAAW
jgi:hypothetical protein